MKNNNTFKSDIQKAEKIALMISWIGVSFAIGVIAFSIWGIV